MKLASPKFPSKAESPGVPEDVRWIDDYMSPRDSNVKDIARCLQGLLTLPDNGNTELRLLDLEHDIDMVVTLKTLKGSPQGAIVLWCNLYDHPHLRWEILDQKKIKLAVKWDSVPTEKVKTRILVFGA